MDRTYLEGSMRGLIAFVVAGCIALVAAALAGIDTERIGAPSSRPVTVVQTGQRMAAPVQTPPSKTSFDSSAAPAEPCASPAAPGPLRSVSRSIRHVPPLTRCQNLEKYKPYDPKYRFKTAWGECVTLSAAQSRHIEARCEIRTFKLLEFDSPRPARSDAGLVVGDAAFKLQSGERRPIECKLTEEPDGSYRYVGPCYGANFYRATCAGGSCDLEWYRDTNPSDGESGSFFPGDNMIVTRGMLKIDAARHPDRVAHWWTEANNPPTYRTLSRPGKHYLVEIEFRTIGRAALRIGLDRWTAGEEYEAECNWPSGKHQNCEDYNSDWYRTADGWTRARLPVFPR